MKNNLTAEATVTIDAPVSDVWYALTTPEEIKKYFFGTETISEWKEGSSIVFKGEWEGKPYEDRGTILELVPEKKLKYNYWSSLSGTQDIPENYANISYQLTPKKNGTLLEVTQDGLDSEEQKSHSESTWKTVLNNLNELLKP